MSENAVKEVKVTLNATDELALMGGKKPRRARMTRKQRGGASDATDASPESGRVMDSGGSLSPLEAAVGEGSQARFEKVDVAGPQARVEKVDAPAPPPSGVESRASSGLGSLAGAPLLRGGGEAPRTTEPISPLAIASSITPRATVLPSLSTTSAVSAPGAVKIGGKRGASEVPTVSTVPIARIVPHKRRIGGAPAAQTLRKPKFHIGVGGSESPGNSRTEVVAGTSGTDLEVVSSGGAVKQTRRFKERKIRLTVKADSARKFRKSVKTKVKAMSLPEVKALLLKKNIIKASAAEKIPEPMMRSMLRDYMLLHNNE